VSVSVLDMSVSLVGYVADLFVPKSVAEPVGGVSW
jgi:hypothetical protein